MVQIDPVKMGQVLRNIFLNAVNFTNYGQILVTLMTHKRDNGDSLVTISVKDSGSGLSRIKLLQLFDDRIKFNTIGSGLGLYVSKEIIKLHKGANLWAESDGEGKGSTFFIQIVAVELDVKEEWDIDLDQVGTTPKHISKHRSIDPHADGPRLAQAQAQAQGLASAPGQAPGSGQVDISVPVPSDRPPSVVARRSIHGGRIGDDATTNEGKSGSPRSPTNLSLSGMTHSINTPSDTSYPPTL